MKSGWIGLRRAGVVLLIVPFLAVAAGSRAADAETGSVATGSDDASMSDAQVDLQKSFVVRQEATAEAVASQDRIEVLSDETENLLTEYRAALRQTESLRSYNGQMDTLIGSQEVEMASLGDQLDQIDLVSRDITPLMLRMIEALDQFVALDLPFLADERRERIDGIRAMMDRANVSEAEKYRRIMEAYQVENEYGRTIEAYRSALETDGRKITVDFLRVGRIALVYQSLDESEAGVWNQQKQAWEPLDGSYRSAIRQGLRVARKQSAPDLIRLPLPSAEPAEASGGSI